MMVSRKIQIHTRPGALAQPSLLVDVDRQMNGEKLVCKLASKWCAQTYNKNWEMWRDINLLFLQFSIETQLTWLFIYHNHIIKIEKQLLQIVGGFHAIPIPVKWGNS